MVMCQRKIFSFLVMGLIFSLCIFGCGDDKGTGGDIESATGQIGPLGGSVDIAGKVSLLVPPGALDTTIDFSITVNHDPTPMDGVIGPVSECFTIEPSGTEFLYPVALTVSYTMPQYIIGEESDIILYADHGSGWEELPTTVNDQAKYVATYLETLSDFTCGVDTSAILFADGIYARLIVSRVIGSGGVLVYSDTVYASLDSAYSPFYTMRPYGPLSISCNEIPLEWQAEYRWHFDTTSYELEGYLEPGETYTFNVDSLNYNPELIAGIEFPELQTYISHPRPTPMGVLDTFLISSGFTTTWGAAGSGDVSLIITTPEDQGYLLDTLVWKLTENDGSYTFTPDDLTGIAVGTYRLIITNRNRETITAPGYDPRSYIDGRVSNSQLFYLK